LNLRGVVTDRDIVVRAIARGVEPLTVPVKNLDSEDVVYARPEWDVEDAPHGPRDGVVDALLIRCGSAASRA
jgi:hypothetical protein